MAKRACLQGFPSSLLPRARSRALIPFPFPFDCLPRRLLATGSTPLLEFRGPKISCCCANNVSLWHNTFWICTFFFFWTICIIQVWADILKTVETENRFFFFIKAIHGIIQNVFLFQKKDKRRTQLVYTLSRWHSSFGHNPQIEAFL